MASIATSRLGIFAQSTPGDNGTDEQFELLNVTLPGPTGGPANTVVESQKIDPDRNAPGSKLVGASSGLTIPFEAQVPTSPANAFWQLTKASVYSDAEDSPLTSANNTTWSGTTLNIAAGDDAAWDGGAVEVGDILQIYSAAAPTVKYYARATAIVGDITSITTDITSPTAATDLRIKKGRTVVNGSSQVTFGILRSFKSPNSPTYDLWCLHTQEAVEACNLAVNAQSIITGSFTTVGVGMSEVKAAVTDLGIGTPTFAAGPTSDILDGTNDLPFVRIGGVDFTLQGLQIGWANNSQTRRSIGTYAAQGISAGTFRGTGQFTAYFDDRVEFNKAINGTSSSCYFVCEDSSGRALIISVPQIRYGNPTLPGQDRDIIATLPFSFEKDDVEGISIRISYIN